MKKVLQIINYMYPHIGGIEQVGRDILNSLKYDCEMRIICFNHGKGTIEDVVDGIPVTRVNCIAKVASQSIAPSFGKELKKVLNSFQPDVVIFHYPNPFEAHYFVRYLKKKAFKLILWWHLDIVKQKILGKLFYKQNKKLLQYADVVVATTPNYIDGSRWLSSVKDKCRVIPCCVGKEHIEYGEKHEKLAKSIKDKYSGKTICFAFGRHVPYKGIGELVDASQYLSDNYVVLIGGEGPLTESLMAKPSKDNVVFLGRVSDDDLKGYLLACDLFCFPSITKNEAFGIGLAEAMYYGKPAVTFNIPGSGVNYVSLADKTGLEVPNCDVKAFAEAIMKLGSSKELAATFGKNAKDRVVELFMPEKFAEATKECVNG